MAKAKIHSCKVGTQPALVILKGNTKPALGKVISFRDAKNGSPWRTGLVDRINPDGYFFMALI
ncbi:hypothetical protein [Iodobacter fluviatilis]|uniref:Uncharacterized protein n=1 Tax=Iodobacter fluviatilis TaxID=537 RepID=A0A7G3GFM8_9NEIS|nr:hypothetical protein [Iodobacter fluviatilis]QBC45863.1 hypothetical protein C1H71_20180 [Iodobacter fluviatilis]